MKKKILTAALIIISSLIILLTYQNKNNVSFSNEIKNNNNLLSIMLETSSGSGNYQEQTSNSFPTTGYTFNESLSGCENGGELSYDSTNKKVIMEGNSVDKCYVYFDIYKPTFVDDLKSVYTGVQGENGLYFHDSSLTNGANDNSYRYAGANPNNYVCFGSDETTCPENNLYRIIGIFNNQIKLIKYDYANSNLLGTDGDYSQNTYSKNDETTYKGTYTSISRYFWNYKNDSSINNGLGSNIWSTSLLNKINLNTNYLNNIGSKWTNMIATTKWIITGNSQGNILEVTASKAYQNEIINSASNATYNAKVGLMYVSDYGFAAAPSAWTLNLERYSESTITSNNWMYMGLYEWTITPNTSDPSYIYEIEAFGYQNYSGADAAHSLRPTFYLNNSVVKTSGDGTKTNPYRIS